jgi:hypothetical protein
VNANLCFSYNLNLDDTVMLSSSLLLVEFKNKIEGKFQRQVSSYQQQHSSESDAINIMIFRNVNTSLIGTTTGQKEERVQRIAS